MRVLGIDPGLNVTGYGVVIGAGRSLTVVEAGVIRPGGADRPLEARLAHLFDGLASVLAQLQPEAVASPAALASTARPPPPMSPTPWRWRSPTWRLWAASRRAS